MSQRISWINNANCDPKQVSSLVDKTTEAEVKKFHRSFDEYKETPLYRLEVLAEHLGLGEVFVKDESKRFGLNAFKVLGASYAMGKSLAKRLGRPLDELPFSAFKSTAVKKTLGELVFAATTDGNHGRSVAWTAAQLGFPAHIYMPKGSAASRVENIRKLGAQAEITAWNYDETVRWLAEKAQKEGWEIVQDTAWPGYEDVPRWIMQGYSTLGAEILEQMGQNKPTHVFLQAGVGAFAGVMASLFIDAFPENPPKIVILEARPAECFYYSIKAGKKTAVGGDLNTIMAGLACGEPNPLAWEILSKAGSLFVAAPDWVSALGMRVLAAPLAGDPPILSGESGAVGAGILAAACREADYSELKEALELNKDSKVVLISTEGDTDPLMYRRVVWEGAYPLPR